MHAATAPWQIWIDRGGTFTDCLGLPPGGGRLRVAKVLSTDDAVTVGIRALMGLAADAPIPPCELRLGTTVATNALLERRGDATVLITSRGFGDALEIGDQTRPRLFGLDIERPPPLYARVIEVERRGRPDGTVEDGLDRAALEAALADARAAGLSSVAVTLLHGYAVPAAEQELAALARAHGFSAVVCSSEVAPEIGLVARGQTTVVDAYVSPVLHRYLDRLAAELPGSSLLLMQSSGGLAKASGFRGRDAILSGPAGGAIAYAALATKLGQRRAIGFDMGGTSTDVSCFDGELDRVYETEVAGAPLRVPMIEIHTVAAGGGSICRYDGVRLTVGPESAGAVPGPLCYGHPEATDLTLTDINLVLGRLVPSSFPFPLVKARAEAALAPIARALGLSIEATAEGFAALANASMAAAIHRVTIARGRDARQFALHVFGGAGGQHACGVARALELDTLVFHPLAGVLSALGMGLAPRSLHLDADAGRLPLDRDGLTAAHELATRLIERGLAALTRPHDGPSDGDDGQVDGDAGDAVAPHPAVAPEVSCRVDLRYLGTESALTIALPFTGATQPSATAAQVQALATSFADAHRAHYGYVQDAPLEICVVRVEVCTRLAHPDEPAGDEPAGDEPVAGQAVSATHGHAATAFGPVFDRAVLAVGERLYGPAIILDPTGTIVVDADFFAERTDADLVLIKRDRAGAAVATARADAQAAPPTDDPVLRDILGNAYMDVARRMGEVLRRTAVSTNIRDRLDFSCALFSAAGELIANAPHIPVHLGAMGETVKAVLAAHPHPKVGDVFASNDPFAGGSHLPDVTVVTPVHDAGGALSYVVACRGHHADIGGISPGSMPPFSTTIGQEGVLLSAVRIVSAGTFDEAGLRATLAAGPYPARRPDDVLRDLKAQLAANQAGIAAMRELFARHGEDLTLQLMAAVLDQGERLVATAIGALPDGHHTFEDALDDGSRIAVRIDIEGEAMRIDFAGSAGPHPGNLNAPRAVTVAAVLYVLRSLVSEDIPLNAGCARPVRLHVPAHSMLAPDRGCAVVAGNVETSQRIVDVLLGALGLAAASQGTMNNLTFGDEHFGYYETLAGGAGATPRAAGASAVHTHMTNTRITDAEILEARYPVRVERFAIRRGSGGRGQHRGGDGLIRELRALVPLHASVLSERRRTQPFGLAGGEPGARGRNLHNGRALQGRATVMLEAGDVLTIETPGGGGFGAP